MRCISACILIAAGALGAWAQDPQMLRLGLKDVEKLALQNHPRLAARKYTAAAAEQVIKQAHAAYEPAFNINLTTVGADDGSRLAAGALNNPIVYSRFASGIGLTQLITDFGRTSNLVASAKLRAQAQDRNVDAARQEVLLEADRAYFDLLRRQSLLKVSDETVRARRLVVDQITALANSKMRSLLDLSFAKVNLAEAQLVLAGAQNDVKSARARLATAMGIPGERNFEVEEASNPEPLPDKVADLVSEALQNRPDLAGVRLEQSAEQRYAKAEQALAYPSIGLFATTGVVPAAPEVIPGKFGAAGININIPVFNGGLFRARRSEAELHAKALQENVRDEENRIARDVQVTYMNALTAYERIGLTAQMLDQTRLALELAQKRYELGLSSVVELSQAQLNLTSAEMASASAKYDYQSQRALLEYQLGAL